MFDGVRIGEYDRIVARREAILKANPHLAAKINGVRPTIGVENIALIEVDIPSRTKGPQHQRAPVYSRMIGRMPFSGKIICQEVCKVFGLPVVELMSHHRYSYQCLPRYAAWRIIDRHLRWSSTTIGKMFNRDHTTVLQGLKRAKELRRHNHKWCDQYDLVIANLGYSEERKRKKISPPGDIVSPESSGVQAGASHAVPACSPMLEAAE